MTSCEITLDRDIGVIIHEHKHDAAMSLFPHLDLTKHNGYLGNPNFIVYSTKVTIDEYNQLTSLNIIGR